MITTPEPVLQETSNMLNESTTDTSAKRVSYFNRSVRKVISMRKWSWAKKKHDLAVSAGVQEYDLTSVISDYNIQWGIYEVWVGGKKIDPVNYDRRDNIAASDARFYLTPDNKKLGFTKTIDGTEDIDVWYYQVHVNAANHQASLNIPLPEDIQIAVALYIKHLVHEGKRQRYDSRNAILDFQQVIEELVLQDASNKAKDLPKTVPTVFTYARVRRIYRY